MAALFKENSQLLFTFQNSMNRHEQWCNLFWRHDDISFPSQGQKKKKELWRLHFYEYYNVIYLVV